LLLRAPPAATPPRLELLALLIHWGCLGLDAIAVKQKRLINSKGGGAWRPKCCVELTLGRNGCLVLEGITQHMAASPERLDEILAVRRVGELLAQLTDENVDDLNLRLIHPAI
jgi:hypothetical protein